MPLSIIINCVLYVCCWIQGWLFHFVSVWFSFPSSACACGLGIRFHTASLYMHPHSLHTLTVLHRLSPKGRITYFMFLSFQWCDKIWNLSHSDFECFSNFILTVF